MELTYLKVFVDYLDAIEPLSDAERGRLFTALLEYGRTGVAPQLGGNERFLFPMMKAQIDRDKATMEAESSTFSEAGKKGAKARWQGYKKDSLDSQAKPGYKNDGLDGKEEDKDKDKEEDKDKNIPPKSPQGDVFADFAGENEELLDALREFEAMRKAIKKPMTDLAKKKLVGKLKEFAGPYHAKQRYMVECLHESILNDWQSVYELKDFQDSEPDRPPVKMHWVVPNPDSDSWEDLVP